MKIKFENKLSNKNFDCLNLFNLKLNEFEILSLQDRFLKKELSFINFKNMNFGRKVIYKILNSIRIYKNIGCIAEVVESLENKNIINFFELFCAQNMNNYLEAQFLVILKDLEIDFLWIEMSLKIKEKYKNIIELLLNKKHDFAILVVFFEEFEKHDV